MNTTEDILHLYTRMARDVRDALQHEWMYISSLIRKWKCKLWWMGIILIFSPCKMPIPSLQHLTPRQTEFDFQNPITDLHYKINTFGDENKQINFRHFHYTAITRCQNKEVISSWYPIIGDINWGIANNSKLRKQIVMCWYSFPCLPIRTTRLDSSSKRLIVGNKIFSPSTATWIWQEIK